MHNYLSPHMEAELREISAQGLAHAGDAVFELMVRTYLCSKGIRAPDKLHEQTVKYVSARAQASMSEIVLPLLSEEETAVFRRGRNAHTGSVPKSASTVEYSKATGLEALFGYLYLSGNKERLNELFKIMIEVINAT